MTVRNRTRDQRVARRRRQRYYWSAVVAVVPIAWAAGQGWVPSAQERAEPEVPPVVASAPPWKAAGVAEAPVVADLASHGIPVVAHRAYVDAAGRLAEEEAQCGIDWSLIAAIGRVETDHGRFGGTQLRADGFTSQPIRGLRLDGSNSTARITDTDGGGLDGDRVFDRAVGPMQFIPATWRSAGAGGNADNIVDAAAGTGRYLCGNGEDLRGEPGQRAAVFVYNNSAQYVDLVLRIAAAYRAGHGAVVPGPEPEAGRADHAGEALNEAPVPEPTAPPPLEIPDIEVPPAVIDPGPVPAAPPTDPPESTPAPASSDAPEAPSLPDPSLETTSAPAESDALPEVGAGTSEGSGATDSAPPSPTTTDPLSVVHGQVELPDCPVGAAIEVRSADGSILETRIVDAAHRLDVRGVHDDGPPLEQHGCTEVRPLQQ
ncbi:hypothetical protein [Saccharopolyspora mangrovi]|uniref:Transglycosylase SLT domain-containing protein n=1 Tax=Saccharopolyspora mangrovi TaxID=3082379 RepID=A0ABU6AGU5_9PSEU|nr:hypothetical protein [Saccharopolyspora sp. S2-29]MEB3370793.1 hypothetical protein [Saccharopolyspora sp. S2-29]